MRSGDTVARGTLADPTPEVSPTPLKNLPKLRCPICDALTQSKVTGSRVGRKFYWRQRRCTVCHNTYTTKEIVAAADRPAAPHLNKPPPTT